MNTLNCLVTTSKVLNAQIRPCLFAVLCKERHGTCKEKIFSTKKYGNAQRFSNDTSKPNVTQCNEELRNGLRKYILQHKEKLKNTEEKIKQRGIVILKDIKETKDKVRTKVEEVIEVHILCFVLVLVCHLFIFLERKRVHDSKLFVRLQNIDIAVPGDANSSGTL